MIAVSDKRDENIVNIVNMTIQKITQYIRRNNVAICTEWDAVMIY